MADISSHYISLPSCVDVVQPQLWGADISKYTPGGGGPKAAKHRGGRQGRGGIAAGTLGGGVGAVSKTDHHPATRGMRGRHQEAPATSERDRENFMTGHRSGWRPWVVFYDPPPHLCTHRGRGAIAWRQKFESSKKIKTPTMQCMHLPQTHLLTPQAKTIQPIRVKE